MAVKYEVSAVNTGGRKGHVKTSDNVIDLPVIPPDQSGEGVNPEQLFAAGYASCFNGAFDLMIKKGGVRDAEPEVDLTVRLEEDGEGVKLSVAIAAKVKNMSQEDAEKYLQQAHDFCPYSKATRGNVDVDLSVEVVE